MTKQRRITIINEVANAVTHGIGAGLSFAALVLLVVYACIYGNAWHVVSFSIYGFTLIMLYLASTLYHSIQNQRAKHILKIIDHSAIYLLIAGTYTPFTLVTLRESWGWVLFGIIWGLALAGILFKTFFVNRFVILSTIMYIVMGWLIIVSIRDLLLKLPPGGIIFLLSGGLSYTIGVLFYAQKQRFLCHAVWHLFVLGGSICHFFAVMNILHR